MSIRCPECMIASLNTPNITIRLDKTRKQTIPIKVCHRCLVFIIGDKAKIQGWKIWNGESYVEYG